MNAESIFEVARRLDANERAAYLDDACGDDAPLRAQVDALLNAEAATAGFIDEPDTAAVTADLAEPFAPPLDATTTSHEQRGQRIDRYTLLEPIGEGGFGTVWLAEQREPVKRRVAFKVIKLGMDTRQVIARFEAERQALAVMDHPSIAKVFDAGSTETGRPYFVMEFVEGVEILSYCDSQKLDTEARLRLFEQVCHAIQHAHQKGIIHRDIKPSNVLITTHDGKPVPKVIDFGIAKATNTEEAQRTVFTEQNQVIGTPAYMSPEQAEMSDLDIDTRSDVYSLGVLLYELLTGTTPFVAKDLMSRGFGEMMRVIREEEPHKPSTRLSSLGDAATQTAERRRSDVRRLATVLRGDLDWIVMKCLEKERTRRYDTATGLAADVERHLADEPVLAGPPSASYRLRKFTRRHRVGVLAGATVAVVLVLGAIGTTGGLVWALSEAERADANADAARSETARAERELARATEVKGFIAEMLRSVDPDVAQGLDTTLMRQILEGAVGRLERGRVADELIEAELRMIIGETYFGLGEYTLAGAFVSEALDTRRRVLGKEDPATLASVDVMGSVVQAQGKVAEAESYFREAMEGRRRVLGNEHPDTLASINNMAAWYWSYERLEEAGPLYMEALEGRRRVLGNDHPDTLRSIGNVGTLLGAQGKLAEAEPYYRESLEGHRRVLGNDHSETLIAINNMGFLMRRQGKLAETERYFKESLEGQRRVLGDEHPKTLVAINNMGGVLWAQGKRAEAEPFFLEALAVRRRLLGSDHPDTLLSVNNLGFVLNAQGKHAEAEPFLREAMEGRRRALGDDHPAALSTTGTLGELLNTMGRSEEALVLLKEAEPGARRVLTGGDLGHYLARLGAAQAVVGDDAAAETTLLEAHELLEAQFGAAHGRTVACVRSIVALYEAWHEADPDAGHDAKVESWRARLGMEGEAGGSD